MFQILNITRHLSDIILMTYINSLYHYLLNRIITFAYNKAIVKNVIAVNKFYLRYSF